MGTCGTHEGDVKTIVQFVPREHGDSFADEGKKGDEFGHTSREKAARVDLPEPPRAFVHTRPRRLSEPRFSPLTKGGGGEKGVGGVSGEQHRPYRIGNPALAAEILRPTTPLSE